MSIFKQQRENVRVSIQDTTIKLFKEKGYENVTIDEITKTVGIAKGTFYNFFSTKFDILLLWAEQEFSRIDFKEIISFDKTLEENLGKLIEKLVEEIQKNEMLFRSFITEIIRVSGDSKFDFISIFRGLITNSKDFKEIGTALLDEKIVMLDNIFFLGLVNWFNQGNSSEGLEIYLNKMKNICLFGIMTDFEGRQQV